MQLPYVANILGLTQAQVALILSGAAIIFALRRWRTITLKKKSAQAYADASPRHPSADHRDLNASSGNSLSVREVATELASLLGELEETSRRVAAQIENRRTGLEILLKEADDKIRRLEALARGNNAPPSTASTAGARTQARIETRSPTPPPPSSIAAHDAALTLSRLRQERGAPVATEDPAYRPIYQMSDLGKNAREIAAELGRQPGEIELILALRGRQRVAPLPNQ